MRTLVLTLLFTLSFSAVFAEEGVKIADGMPVAPRPSAENLSSASILPPHLGMPGQPRDTYACGPRVPRDREKVFFLSRPGEKDCVAVAVDGPRGAYLNPLEEFDYGSIPALERLTQEQAQQLWGIPTTKSSPTECTFLLKSKAGAEVFIDAEFKDRKLFQYRVRSSLFSVNNWVRLKLPTLPEGSPKPDVD